MSKLQRRLAAIMFTDIVGYSAMMQKDEVFANRKRNRHRKVFDDLTKTYEGQILQYYGDGTLSIFNSTAAAVECAVGIQIALKQEPKVSIRIGIHTGDVTLSDDDIFGDGVNIASRVESLCVPGGVYISGKVYDDIKNHPTLKATFVGKFDLKNIHDSTTVYAISNPGITIPDQKADIPTTTSTFSDTNKIFEPGDRKKQKVAALLAITLGLFGVHRFYLGNRKHGITYLSIGGLGIVLGIGIMISAIAILSVVDAVLLFTMPEGEFDKKYNPLSTSSTKPKEKEDPQVNKQKSLLKAKFERHLVMAQNHYQQGNYQGAIEVLDEALEIKYDNMDAHFLLAKCYSMTANGTKALIHADAAIAFDLDARRLKFDHALAFLRTRPGYKVFEKNGFRILDDPPIAKEEIKATTAAASAMDLTTPPDLLEQFKKLKELRERGFLTEEEYLAQQEKLTKEL